jgi:hypothetical protein
VAAAPPGSAPPADVPTFDPNASPDPERVAALMDEGLDEGLAIFAALTQVNAEQVSPLSYRITHSYPTGNSGEMTVTLTPDQAFDPDAAETISANYTETDGDFAFRLEFFIGYDDIPDDVEEDIRGAVATADERIAFAGLGVTAFGPTAAETSGVKVVAEGIVKKLEEAGISKFIEYLDQALGTNALIDKLNSLLDAGLSAKDAWSLGTEHDQLMAKVDDLEECAENPTNPVTRRGYESDPSQKQRILDRVAEVRVEIKSNIAVMFLGLINTTATGLGGAASKVLGFIVGPATDYIKQELSELNERLIEELEKLITDCEAYEFSGVTLEYSITDPANTPLTRMRRVTEVWSGSVCGDPLEAEWTITVQVTTVTPMGEVDPADSYEESARARVSPSAVVEIGEMHAVVTYRPDAELVEVEEAGAGGWHVITGSETVPLEPIEECPGDG